MREEDQRFVIVVDIVDAKDLEQTLVTEEGPSAYRDQIIRPVAARLQTLCDETDATMTNSGGRPFVLESRGARETVKIGLGLVAGDSRARVSTPKGWESSSYVQFHVGIAKASSTDEDSYRGVSQAHALAGGAGANEIYLEGDVAEVLMASDVGAPDILFRGRHNIIDELDPTLIFELRAPEEFDQPGKAKGEVVRLTLAVIDIMHSTSLKPLMGVSQQERLENYNRQILEPFREMVKNYATKFSGRVVDMAGDACFLSFDDPEHARRWAVECIKEENRIPSPDGYQHPEVKYHLSIDSGRVMRDSSGLLQGNYVDRVHRLNDLSHEDQIILSPPVATTMQGELADEKTEGR
ncbi:MAG: hypothetical protein AAGJ31_13175, partial [Verrucomicrobiota bacterium]